MKIDLYAQTGDKKGQIEVNDTYFKVPYNEGLIHQALVRQHANKRVAIAHVKQRGDIRGGGRKPFRQKGTGNARQGTSRSPLNRGGGVIFGPRNVRNFSKNMPKKQRRKALFSALSAKAQNNDVIALDNYESKEVKTKTFAEMVKKLPIKQDLLFVIDKKNEVLQKSSSNISNVKTIIVNYLNIADLQKYEKVMFMQEAIKEMENIFGEKSN